MSRCITSYQGLKFLFHHIFHSVDSQSIVHDICVVVNNLPGGEEALRCGTAGSGQCVHLNGDMKFL